MNDLECLKTQIENELKNLGHETDSGSISANDLNFTDFIAISTEGAATIILAFRPDLIRVIVYNTQAKTRIGNWEDFEYYDPEFPNNVYQRVEELKAIFIPDAS